MPRKLWATAAANDREYDGSLNVECDSQFVVGYEPLDGDDVKVGASGTMADKNVGADKLVTVSLSLSGTDASNYVVEQQGTTTVSIKPREVALDQNSHSFLYSGNKEFYLFSKTMKLEGVVSGDGVSADVSNAKATVPNANVQYNAEGNVSTQEAKVEGLTLVGADAGNYVLPENPVCTIMIRPLDIAGATVDFGSGLVYDGQPKNPTVKYENTELVSGQDYTIEGDLTNSDTYLNKPDDRKVIIHGQGNYSGEKAAPLSIGQKMLDDVQVTPVAKVYDGSALMNTSDWTATIKSGVIEGDDVSAEIVGFVDAPNKDVGTYDANVWLKLTGDAMGNYALVKSSWKVGGVKILPRELRYIKDLWATYNGSNVFDDVVVYLDEDSYIEADKFGLIMSMAKVTVEKADVQYDESGNLMKQQATVTGLALSGDCAKNYVLPEDAEFTLTILPKSIRGAKATIDNDVYDGKPKTITVKLDDVKLTEGKDYELDLVNSKGQPVGTATDADDYQVKVAGIGNYGAYSLDNITIRPKSITGATVVFADTLTGATTYDTKDKPLVIALDGVTLVEGVDFKQTIYSANGDTINGDGKRGIFDVGFYSSELQGMGNYTGNAKVNDLQVQPCPLTVTGTAVDRAYDGTDAVALTDLKIVTQLYEEDAEYAKSVQLVGTGKLRDGKDAGEDKVVDLTFAFEQAPDGTDSDFKRFSKRYTIENPTMEAQVTISPEALTVVPEQIAPFAYTGKTDVPLSKLNWTLEGLVSGDDVKLKLDDATASVETADVGEDKPVTITGWKLEGTDAANYAATAQARTVTITKAPAPQIQWPTLNDMTYGDSLGDMKLSDDNGAFHWKGGDMQPGVGEHEYTLVYTPKDTDNYDYSNELLEKDYTLNVKQAPAPKIEWPTAGDITYGQTLGDSVLSHTEDDHGSFAWEKPDYQPDASGDMAYNMVYTPDDAVNYDYTAVDLTRTVAINVHKAQAVIDVTGVTTAYTYTGEKQTVTGAKLNHAECELVYTGNTFTDVPEGGKQRVTISAAETKNYLSASETVEITVSKAKATIDVSGVATDYTYTGKLQTVTGAKLNHAECELVYANNTFTTVAEGNGRVVKITAAETANYLAAEANVTIHVAKATALPEPALPTLPTITYGQKLSDCTLNGGSGLGSFTWQDGDVMPGAGTHTFRLVFTPNDRDNYAWPEEVTREINVTIQPKLAVLAVKNATKAFGEADPKANISVTGLLAGDSLDYTVTREPGEAVGQYAYSVKLGQNPNYRIDLVEGKLTIEPRSISDEGIQGILDAQLGNQTYTGKPICPELTLKLGDVTLVPGTDYELSYANNVKPGTATITITGKGAFTGTTTLTFTIDPVKATKAPEKKPATILELLQEMPEIVFDEQNQSRDYESRDNEQILVMIDDAEQAGSLLISAAPDENGEYGYRSLVLNAALLVKLRQEAQEDDTGMLVFENGDVATSLTLTDLTGGDMAKLVSLIRSGEAISEETLNTDWSAMEDVTLTAGDYENFDLELRVVPDTAEDGTEVFEISVWLRWNGQSLNVSGLLPSLRIHLNVNDRITAENAATFTQRFAIAWQSVEDGDVTTLPSALLCAPAARLGLTVAVGVDAADAPEAAEGYALTAPYAGEGRYWLQAIDN